MDDRIYAAVARQLREAVCEWKQLEGVVEVEVENVQFVLWWEIEKVLPFGLKRWLALCFQGGVRCGHDFEMEKLSWWYEKQ